MRPVPVTGAGAGEGSANAIHWHIHHWPFQGYVSVNSESSATLFRSNVQTGRRIPFETGSFNMHSLLSLHAPAKGVAAAVLRRRLPERHPPPQQPARWLASRGSGRRR